ncbi:hypothetical protein POM88_006408 [Heracleum sosnowskyi]|uniref:ATP-dependent DNA helicase n=1 Tax=Heracleum sosnowskyi TaxID=360622 RepID=A0AAD8J2J1_9APIA|nr:hypothetical protein POM88_006408 [Heracleum sosnowskyi]
MSYLWILETSLSKDFVSPTCIAKAREPTILGEDENMATVFDTGGTEVGVVYTVEFQKRGLPHAHIVLWLATADKLLTVDDIDNVISAEIPDKVADPVGYKAVSQFMMHGPCGAANPKCPCMSNGQCTKHYPKPFSDATVMSDDGYALYRRRETKLTIECNGVHLDNRAFVETIPEELFIHYSGDPLAAIVKEIYSELHHMHGDLEYIRNRAILTPLNEHVENVNNTVLQMLPGDFKEYKSCDSVCKGSSHSEADEVLYPPEFLNSLKFSGMPNHDIKVKVVDKDMATTGFTKNIVYHEIFDNLM